MLISSETVSRWIRPWGWRGVRSSKPTFSESLSGSSELMAATRWGAVSRGFSFGGRLWAATLAAVF
jgi:hypothetical protein